MRDEAELKFEKKLCNYLCSNDREHKWEYIDVHTTDELWDNFKKILYSLNKEKLSHPLTNKEFNRVRRQILNINTPYDAGKFIYGTGGRSKIQIEDDNGENVFLTIFDKNNTRDNHYQLARQVRKSANDYMDQDSRFDVTLLINGLPIIQIEEKRDGVDSKTAVRQMHEYIHERKYTDIFSTLQILIAMTPDDIWYMANSTDEDFNEDFAFRWKKDGDNSNKLLDWKEFCDSFLNPPFAYEMATKYMILDDSGFTPSLKVMRYYQVYATRNVIDKLKNHNFEDTSDNNKKIGYVWHTTGSGKTISSYKVAFLASRMHKVKRVIFAVDRVVLTNQTYNKYKSYVPEKDAVKPVDNTRDLKKKLESNSESDIVVCGLKMLAELFNNNPGYHVDDETVVIVDEAHRSTKGDQVKAIKKGLTKSAWIGFTGTPDFGKEKNITEDIFGPKLHVYTIKDAIQDKNVLGFHVEFQRTINEDEYLRKYEKEKHKDLSDYQIEQMVEKYSSDKVKSEINQGAYSENREESKKHIRQVVNDILINWNRRSNDRKFNAILTVKSASGTSKGLVFKYYKEFKKQIREAKKSDNATIPTDLKIAMTFSQNGDHSRDAIENNDNLKEALKDYNDNFGTTFSIKNIDDYFSNLTSRLDKTVHDKKYLDLVIVVDQLLTGFDAPQLNTLYVDRFLEDSNLIQAYSRTNRIYDMDEKPFGTIVNYRFPELSEQYMNKALEKFSNTQDAYVMTDFTNPAIAPSYKTIKEKLKNVVAVLSILTNKFSVLPENQEDQQKTYRKILEYNRLIKEMKQCKEYVDDHTIYDDVGISGDEEKKLTGSLLINLRKNLSDNSEYVPFVDVTSNIETITSVKVTAEYIKELLARYVNNRIDRVSDKNIDQSNNKDDILSKMGNVLNDEEIMLVNKYMVDPESFSFKEKVNSGNVLDVLRNILDSNNEDHVDQIVNDFINKFGLQKLNIENKLREHIFGMDEGHETDDIDDIRNDGLSYYADDSTNNDIKNMNNLDYALAFNNDLKRIKKEIKEDN